MFLQLKPTAQFQKTDHERRVVDYGYNAVHRLQDYPDALAMLQYEHGVENFEHVLRLANGLRNGNEVSLRDIRRNIAILKILATVLERDRELDYGTSQHTAVIVEARQQQIEGVREALRTVEFAARELERFTPAGCDEYSIEVEE